MTDTLLVVASLAVFGVAWWVVPLFDEGPGRPEPLHEEPAAARHPNPALVAARQRRALTSQPATCGRVRLVVEGPAANWAPVELPPTSELARWFIAYTTEPELRLVLDLTARFNTAELRRAA